GRDGHGHRIDVLEQRVERRVRYGVELLRYLGGAGGGLVVDPRERDARHAPQQSGVVESQGPGAHHARAHAHTITPRCDPSMNFRKFSTSGICGSSARALAMPWPTVMSELNSSR